MVARSTKTITNLSPETSANNKHILGIQANVRTETMPDEQRLSYMLFPRIAALAAEAWTKEKTLMYSPISCKIFCIMHASIIIIPIKQNKFGR